MATLNAYLDRCVDVSYVRILGMSPGIVLSKFIYLIGENEDLEITIDQLVESLNGFYKKTTIKHSIRTLIDLDLIKKEKRYRKELGGSVNVYSLNLEKINKLAEGVKQ